MIVVSVPMQPNNVNSRYYLKPQTQSELFRHLFGKLSIEDTLDNRSLLDSLARAHGTEARVK